MNECECICQQRAHKIGYKSCSMLRMQKVTLQKELKYVKNKSLTSKTSIT